MQAKKERIRKQVRQAQRKQGPNAYYNYINLFRLQLAYKREFRFTQKGLSTPMVVNNSMVVIIAAERRCVDEK